TVLPAGQAAAVRGARLYRAGERLDAALLSVHRRALVQLAEPALSLAGAHPHRGPGGPAAARAGEAPRDPALRTLARAVPARPPRPGHQPLAIRRATLGDHLGCRVDAQLAELHAGRRADPAADHPVLHRLFLLRVPWQGTVRRRLSLAGQKPLIRRRSPLLLTG